MIAAQALAALVGGLGVWEEGVVVEGEREVVVLPGA